MIFFNYTLMVTVHRSACGGMSCLQIMHTLLSLKCYDINKHFFVLN